MPKWTTKECKGGLKLLCPPLDGEVSELREQVSETFNDPESPPVGGSPDLVVSVFLHSQAMILHCVGMIVTPMKTA